MHKRFDHQALEQKWQKKWAQHELYTTDIDTSKEKVYVLDMFPYPSGEGLHVGHPKGYIATDIYSRYKKMSGYEVLHPMGWDAFGLPAENFAIKHKIHPESAVRKNIENFKKQLSHLGFNYDWTKEINTTDPAYYKWTQWIFLKLYEAGLAYESYEPINWCPSCQTGLANEDLESDGTCERCGSTVEKRPMRQWVLKITEYADRLLEDLETLELWPEHIKEAQRNWIGKREGAIIEFKLVSELKNDIEVENLSVFTTRPDTLFGATYMVVAPEHPLVTACITTTDATLTNREEVSAYIEEATKKSEIERTNATKEKTGVELKGILALNPATQATIPIYVSDYVLADYGTGAIMAVPAHDERDFAFAQKFNLPVVQVIAGDQILPFADEGVLVDSDSFSGMQGKEAKIAITEHVGGKLTSTYRINDWVFSRQRYWGEPIPIIHCEGCGTVPVPVEDLPVRLPDVQNYEPTGTGESPLAEVDEWLHTTCPRCGGAGRRETNTMPQWAGSSWYYLRFIDPTNDSTLIDPKKEKDWMPVDVYVGGDHAVRHLIYARFWHKFLYDIGSVHTIEPFTRLEFLGFILAEDGRKMSKRWGNVINPDDIVLKNGADTLRVYEMFMGPFENTVAWSTNSLVGAQRFLERVYGLSEHIKEDPSQELESLLQKTIQKVAQDIEAFKFNTAVSAMMIFVNEAESNGLTRTQYEQFLQILAPFAPHITEELWETLGNEFSIHTTSFPIFDPSAIIEGEVTIGVQVNGKIRASITLKKDTSEEEAVSIAKLESGVLRHLENNEIRKVIYVPSKILNFITS